MGAVWALNIDHDVAVIAEDVTWLKVGFVVQIRDLLVEGRVISQVRVELRGTTAREVWVDTGESQNCGHKGITTVANFRTGIPKLDDTGRGERVAVFPRGSHLMGRVRPGKRQRSVVDGVDWNGPRPDSAESKDQREANACDRPIPLHDAPFLSKL